MQNRTKSRLRLVVFSGLGLVAVLALAPFGLLAAMRHEFGRTPPPPHFPPPATRAEANRQDLAYLRQLPDYDRSFSPQAKAAFSRDLDVAVAQAGALDTAGLQLAVARAVALADNGHTNALGVGEGRDLNALPIRMVPFSDGLYIVMATAANADLLGARVVSENGHAVADLSQALRPYEGGSDDRFEQKLPNFLASPEALQAAGLGASATQATLELVLADGRNVTRILTADVKPTAGYGWADRALSPDRPSSARPAAQTSGQPWLHVLDGRARLPVYLQHVDLAYWSQTLDQPQALYIQLNAMRDSGTPPLKTFLDGVLQQVATTHPRKVIVDFRFDGGGDYTLFAGFSRKLPRLLPPDGKLYILTGPNTFSAAITTAARLKAFAGAKAVIVGRTVGDRDRFWGEVNHIHLPNSKIEVQYATGMHDWVHGCTDWSKCYWLNFNFVLGVAAGPLTPNLPAPLSFADYRAGIDPALRAIAGEVNGR